MPFRYGPLTHRQLVIVREAIRIAGPRLREYADKQELRDMNKSIDEFLNGLGGYKHETVEAGQAVPAEVPR